MARAAGLALATALAACGSRSSYWDSQVNTSQTPYGLAGGVAIVDDANHEVVMLTSTSDHGLWSQRLPIGHHFTSAAPTAGLSSLLVLSSGDWPLTTTTDDPPSLTMLTIDQSASPFTTSHVRYGMSEPFPNLVVDPLNQYAVAYQGDSHSTSFATNPNEIVIFDLTKPPGPTNPVTRTLQSFGGSPQQLTFSPTLLLPAQAAEAGVTATERRLLVVETDIDVSLVDLTHAFDATPPPDITVQLTAGTDATPVTPAGVAIDPNENDGWLALRTVGSSSIYTMQLLPTPPGGSATGPVNDFTPSINLVDVGGVPSDIAFVNTSEGLRVAALVPSMSEAVLFEPDKSDTTPVLLSSAYTNMSIVTDLVAVPGSTSTADVAMLWLAASGGGPAAGVALWTLAEAGEAYRSVEVLTVEDPVASVVDVPTTGANKSLKILTTPPGSTHSLYVLDLAARTSSPLDTTATPNISVAPDGGRLWAYLQGGTDLASIDLSTLNPIPLTTSAPIASVFDIKAPGSARTLLAIDASGTFGATVFDALSPATATSSYDVALLLEGP